MQSGKRREFDVVLEPQDEGGYTVYVPELPGCVSEGETRQPLAHAPTVTRSMSALGTGSPLASSDSRYPWIASSIIASASSRSSRPDSL